MRANTFYHQNISKAIKAMWPEFLAQLAKLASTQDQVWLALAGGSSPQAFYEHWLTHAGEIPSDIWAKVQLCLADERLVPITDPDSNFKQLLAQLFQPLYQRGYIDLCQTYPINTQAPDPAAEYTARVRQVDLAILGVGEDGHIASLFPHHALLQGQTMGYVAINDSPKPPSQRITLSAATVTQIDTSLLFFVGEKKRQAYVNFRDENLTPAECPAKLCAQSPQLLVVSDITL